MHLAEEEAQGSWGRGGGAQGRSLSIHKADTSPETERGPRLYCAVLNTGHAHPVPGGLAVGPWQVPVSHPVGSGHPQVRPSGRALRPHRLGCTGLSLSCPEAKLSAVAAVPSHASAQHPWSFKTHHVPQEPCAASEADPAWGVTASV